MISWIQKSFQQHFRVVFAVLLAVTIISFIFTIGAAPGIGRADRTVAKMPFFDLNLGSDADSRKLYGDASLSAYLIFGYVGNDDPRLQPYAQTRYACLAIANELHIPAPTSNEITDYIKGLPRFANEKGEFDAKKYADFRDSHKRDPNFEAELSRIVSDNVRITRVQKLISGPGYVLPSDVKRELALADTSWTLGVATLDYASFNPTITPTEAELSKFFADNNARYQIPAKVSVSYVDFPAAAYVSQINVTEPEVRSFYDSNPARFPKPATPGDDKKPQIPPAPANPAADYALVRPQVEATLKLERAQRLAAKDASDFTVMLYERKVPFGSPDVAGLAAQQGRALKDAPPFSEEDVPAVLGSNPQIGEEAFRLNKDRYFSDALSTGQGSVVLIWKEMIAPRQPLLAEVRAKVTADYVEQEKRKRFLDAGRAVRTQLASHLKSGEAFDKAAEAAAASQGLKVEAKLHPAFTLRQRPQDVDMQVFNSLEHLEKGDVSEMIPAQANKGILVYAADKKVPEVSESNPQYAETRSRIAKYTASENGAQIVRQLVENELAKTASLRR